MRRAIPESLWFLSLAATVEPWPEMEQEACALGDSAAKARGLNPSTHSGGCQYNGAVVRNWDDPFPLTLVLQLTCRSERPASFRNQTGLRTCFQKDATSLNVLSLDHSGKSLEAPDQNRNIFIYMHREHASEPKMITSTRLCHLSTGPTCLHLHSLAHDAKRLAHNLVTSAQSN